MAKEMKDLQTLINEKASARLRKDLHEIRNWASKNRLLTEGPKLLHCTTPHSTLDNSQKKYEGYILEQHFADYSNRYYQAVYEYWLPIYTAEETKWFLEKVDKLSTDVQDLMGGNSSAQW